MIPPISLKQSPCIKTSPDYYIYPKFRRRLLLLLFFFKPCLKSSWVPFSLSLSFKGLFFDAGTVIKTCSELHNASEAKEGGGGENNKQKRTRRRRETCCLKEEGFLCCSWWNFCPSALNKEFKKEQKTKRRAREIEDWKDYTTEHSISSACWCVCCICSKSVSEWQRHWKGIKEEEEEG